LQLEKQMAQEREQREQLAQLKPQGWHQHPNQYAIFRYRKFCGSMLYKFSSNQETFMRRILQCFIALLGSLLFCSAALAQDKVVYHIDNAEVQATKGLRSIRNHLDVAPDTRIVVVTLAEGVDFLLEDAKDKKNPNIDYASLVSALKARGVRFEVCEITLQNRNLKKEQFNLDAEFTPSGVVRIGQLQTRENYGYIKP